MTKAKSIQETSEEMFNRKFPLGIVAKAGIIELMEEYASQFKYDYSQQCKCKDSTGETWCCNLCGLPTNKSSQFQSQIVLPDDEETEEWMLENLNDDISGLECARKTAKWYGDKIQQQLKQK